MNKRFVLLILALFGVSVAAQDTRGMISGTITDPQGAPIAGASVTVTNTGQNTNSVLTTNNSGYYEARFLLPGTYSVAVSYTGFKRSVRPGITVALSDQLQIDVQLEVGGTSESITISAEPPMLDTSTVSTGRAMTNREVMDLPVLGNNITMLTRFAPGVQVPGTTQFLVQGQVGGGSGYYSPGNVGGNEWSMDGASTNGTDRRVSIMPSPDVVDEFKIETSNFDAAFGHATGLNISMSTKAGANDFHGTGTYQYFNQRWNAASFFVKQSRFAQIAALRAAGNISAADALADTPMLPAGNTDNYAATFSGPVFIPKIINGKNKLFFFLGYSKLDNMQAARPSEINYTVPTMAMRQGDFSRLLQADPVRYQVYNPLTTRVDPARPGHWVRDPFPGNIIPRSLFRNPMYDFYTKRMPEPNNDPTDPRREPVNNYLATGMPNNVKYESWTNRFDYQLSDRHRFFFRWLKADFLEDAQDYTYESEAGLMAWNEKRPPLTAAADWTFTLSGSTVLNVSVDGNQFVQQQQRLGTRKYKPTDAGLPTYMDAKCAGSCVMPRVIWPGMTAWSGDMVLSTTVDPGTKGYQKGLKSNITHVRGSHSVRAGLDFRRHYRNQLQNGGFTSGNFTFANTFMRREEDGLTPAGTLGLGWAAFLMGIPTGMSVDTNDTYALMSPYYGWFVQDTWRLRRNLTVTLGLRMEYEQGPTERYNRAISYFDPNLDLPITAAAQAAYARNPLPELPASQFVVKGGTVYTGRNGTPRNLWRNELMWLPRLSMAWQPTNKWVIRAGYGTYFDTLNVMNSAVDQYGFSRATSTVLTNNFGENWLVGNPQAGVSPLTDPFPVMSDGNRFVQPFKDALGSMARAGQGFTYTDFNRRHPRVQRWRMGMQREIARNMVFEAAYWGQWADRINISQRLDALPEKYWSTGLVRNNANASELDRNVPNPFALANFAALRTSDPVLYNHMSTLGFFTSPTIRKNQLLRPFPHMNGLNNNGTSIGQSRTHALEFNLERRFSSGFSMNASYTRMFQDDKILFENEFETAPRIWWPGQNSRPHRFTATGIFELPFGKGKPMLQSGVLGAIFGGWQMAATYEYQPGPLLGWGNIFYYGDMNTFGADASAAGQNLERWFDTSLQFEKLPARTPANYHVRVFPRFFNELRADGLKQWNGNVLRTIRLSERVKLQLRGDAMNLQNRSQMAGPDISPTSTNFGRIQSQTASLNRFYQVQARIQF